MKIKAHVRDGRLIVDEPSDLPEGTELELIVADPGDDLTDAEREALHAALERAWLSARAGHLKPASELVSKSPPGELPRPE